MGRKGKGKPNHFAQRKRNNKVSQLMILKRTNLNLVETLQNKAVNTRPEPYDGRQEPYKEIVRENDNFEIYYKYQKVCPESEYQDFITTLRDNLPVTFRITSTKGESKRLLEIVKEKLFVDYLSGVKELEGDGESLKPKSLCWYPDELAWQLELTRKDIRRSEHLFKLHNFLISETKTGSISRQEAVSMIPPIVLDVKPHHKCLDLCAAPGSKTAQIIEALHSDGSGKIPKGFVLANDVDNKRCYMLVHQAKRLNSPCTLITNSEAGQFPNLFMPDENEKLQLVKFDRILADVPCSGDGTMRKNPDIWLKWTQANALALHGVQYRIARRGAEMLEIGGRMVYSTCSLNPIENEAVLCRLIRECGGAMELVDASEAVKGLKYNPGMTYWEPASKDLRFFKSWSELPPELHTHINKEMFAPPAEEISKYNLQHCIRVLPHQQNTGAFFVSVLEKRKLMPWEDEVNEKALLSNARKLASAKDGSDAVATTDDGAENPRKRKKIHYGGFREDPFVFFTPQEEVFTQLKNFYELDDTFNPECLLTRCETGKKKNIYLCSPEIRSILKNNELNIKLINSGVKTFSRCDNRNMECSFRLANEGLHNVDQFIGDKRRIHLTRDDLIMMLNNLDPQNPPQVSALTEEVQRQHEAITSGSCVLHLKDEKMELHLVGWRGNRTLRAYIDVNDSVHMLRLLGADLTKYGELPQIILSFSSITYLPHS